MPEDGGCAVGGDAGDGVAVVHDGDGGDGVGRRRRGLRQQ